MNGPPPELERTPLRERFDPEIPHPARVYNVWLGGKDGPAEEVASRRPAVVAGAQANRVFLARAVGYIAGERGIRQFLDVGPGLSAPGNTHEVAQAIATDSKIVYVDRDPCQSGGPVTPRCAPSAPTCMPGWPR